MSSNLFLGQIGTNQENPLLPTPFWADPGVLWKKAPRAMRAIRGKTLQTVPFKGISTVLWVHQKLPQSTVSQAFPSNKSYESKAGCNRTPATVLWVPLTFVRERAPGLINHVLTVLVFQYWVLVTPHLPSFIQMPQSVLWPSICIHGPSNKFLDLLSPASLPCPSFPCFFGIPCFFLVRNSLFFFFGVLPFFSRDFRGSVGMKNPYFLMVFLAIFQKKNGTHSTLLLQHDPVLPFLVFWENGKENHQKKKGFFIPTEPLKSREKRGETLKKPRNSSQGEKKQGNPKKQGKEGQGRGTHRFCESPTKHQSEEDQGRSQYWKRGKGPHSHTFSLENNSDHPHPPLLQKICPQNMPYNGGPYGIEVG